MVMDVAVKKVINCVEWTPMVRCMQHTAGRVMLGLCPGINNTLENQLQRETISLSNLVAFQLLSLGKMDKNVKLYIKSRIHFNFQQI